MLQVIRLADVFYGGLRSNRRCSGKNQFRTRGIQPLHQRNNGIVVGELLIGGSGQIRFGLACLWIQIDDLNLPGARPRSDLLKDKSPGARNFQEREIFRRRSDENQIVVLRVVERKKTSALDADLLLKFPKYAVQSMHGQHFPDPGIVIQGVHLAVASGIVIAHPAVRAAHKGRVAENDPRLLGPGEEPSPENAQNRRDIRDFPGQPRFRRSAV